MAHDIVFFGTPEFAEHHLLKLSGDTRYRVRAVVSQPDRPAGRKMQLQPSAVKKLAVQLGLPVFTPESARDPEFIESLKKLNAEAAVVVAYGQILPEGLLSLFPKKVINVHGSLLPRWRGAAPIQRAIMAGDTETGISLQVMVKALDAGDVFAEKRVPIGPDLSAVELHDQLKVMGAELLVETLSQYLKGQIQPVPQNESMITYAKKIEKSEATVDWTLSSQEIYNRFRGLQLGPGSRTKLGGLVLKLSKIRPSLMHEEAASTGEVVGVTETEISVRCGKGSLVITEVQPESRSRMSVAEFLRGHEVKEGVRFE